MSKVEILREMVNQLLMAAAGEIFGLFERTIADYEEELTCSKRENEYQRKLLEAVLKPEVRLHRTVFSADVPHLRAVKGELPSEQQDPEHPQIKVEQEEEWSSHNESIPVKSAGDKDEAQSSQFHQRQGEENREAEPPASSLAQKTETHSDRGDCGGSEPTPLSDCDKTLNSYDNETEDSDDDWKRTTRQQSKFQILKDNVVVGSVSHRNIVPTSDLQPVSEDETSDSSDAKTEDSDDDWRLRRECSSGSSTTREALPSSSECQTKKTSVSCSICGKIFHVKQQLSKHKKTHSGGMTFRCSDSDIGVIQKANLEKHMRSHTRERLLNGSASKKRKDL
ncbi:hypothetical protein PAMA_018885 [Pampus argenteus]